MTMFAERQRYLDSCGTSGGTAPGFREWIKKKCEADPKLYSYDFLRDRAANKVWESQPRKKGSDLFSIAGVTEPAFLTRRKTIVYGDAEVAEPADEDIEGDDDAASISNEEEFEKVALRFATVNDLWEDALIKTMKAGESAAAANKLMKHAEDCRRRARGNMTMFLRDLADDGGLPS